MPTPNPSFEKGDAVTDLATGQLSPLRAWWTRRQIVRDPALARDLLETETLFANLRDLREERPARFAPDWKQTSGKERDMPAAPTVWNIGRFVMNRRAVFAMTAALSLFAVTGGYAAVRYFSASFDGLDAGNGLRWKADLQFRGEVRFYDRGGEKRGSVSGDGDSAHTTIDANNVSTDKPFVSIVRNPVTATVTVNGEQFPLSGAGRHELQSKSGAIFGTAELVPQSVTERESWRVRHNRENGIEQELRLSYGARDGYGQCIGFFDDVPNLVQWRLRGANVQVRFYDVATGKRVYQGTAFDVTDAIRAEKKRELTPGIYIATVAKDVPKVPKFDWAIGQGAYETRTMGEDIRFPLADGMELRAEIVPIDAK